MINWLQLIEKQWCDKTHYSPFLGMQYNSKTKYREYKMVNEATHLDHALEQEFQGHAQTIHSLKVSNAHFHKLMEKNHDLWVQIKNIQADVTPTDDKTLHDLEKQRLTILDEIALMIKAEEAK